MSARRAGTAGRPPGSGPVLASAWPVPGRRRLGVAVLGALSYAVVMAYVIWRGLSWRWAAGTLGATYALVIWMSCRNIVRAGEGWLSKGARYVRTDRLVRVQAQDTTTGACFTLCDTGSGCLHMRPSEISGNPDVWQLVRAGVVVSCAEGLIIDAAAARYFAVQGSLRFFRESSRWGDHSPREGTSALAARGGSRAVPAAKRYRCSGCLRGRPGGSLARCWRRAGYRPRRRRSRRRADDGRQAPAPAGPRPGPDGPAAEAGPAPPARTQPVGRPGVQCPSPGRRQHPPPARVT